MNDAVKLNRNQQAIDTNSAKCITHVVKKGEFFHKIAMRYNCTADNIKTWNSIDSNAIHPGQALKIWIVDDK